MDLRIKKMAKLLVDYSCQVKEEDYVRILGSSASADLVLALEEEIIKRGAYPLTRVSLPGSAYIYYKYANEKQLTHFPHLALHEIYHVQAQIAIIDDLNTKELSSIDPRKQALRAKVIKPIKDYILDPKNKIRWNVTLFPTSGLAQDAEMSLQEFEDFVFSALFLDKEDPIKEWKKLSQCQQQLVNILNAAKTVRIVGKETDLTLSIKGRKAVNCDGHYNMPDGEVFTGPIENSANGKILFQVFPAIKAGKEIWGIRLEFKNGKVIKASAEKNNDLLQAMLNIDEGARRIGELGIGTNFKITKFIKEILFDEKIGKTVHLALGSGYPETGSKNQSAIHWDMIFDLQKEGEVLIDDKKLVQKGDQFLLK